MDSTVAALIGAIIGGLLSVLASWLAQRVQSRSNWLVQEIKQRQQLYSQFVEAASCCFADALQEHEPETAKLAALYGEILDAYASDNHTKIEIVDFLARDTVNLFADFGNACREEIARLQPARIGIEGPLSYRTMIETDMIPRSARDGAAA